MITTCPDCLTPLGGSDRCRCGWLMPRGSAPSSNAAVRFCATVGCEGRALIYSTLCQSCETRTRQEKSEARCRELGLVTVEQKRAYCLRMAKQGFGHAPSFETWAKNISQRTVDIIVTQGGKDSAHCLDRLRNAGAIDEANKLVPLDRREAVRAALEADRRAAREHLEATLAAHGVVRREIDTEAR